MKTNRTESGECGGAGVLIRGHGCAKAWRSERSDVFRLLNCDGA